MGLARRIWRDAADPGCVLVTNADTYATLLAHPNVIAASDIVFANIYPFWEGTLIDNAVCSTARLTKQLVDASGSKQVIISEVGWPAARMRSGPRAVARQ